MKTQGELGVTHPGPDADAGRGFMPEDKEAEGDSTQALTWLRRCRPPCGPPQHRCDGLSLHIRARQPAKPPLGRSPVSKVCGLWWKLGC